MTATPEPGKPDPGLSAAIAWLLFPATGLALFLLGAIRIDTTWTRSEGALVFLVHLEVFYLLFLWPLFLLGRAAPAPPGWHLALVGILSLPLSVIAALIAGATWAQWLTSRFLVVAVSLVPMALLPRGRGNDRAAVAYYVGAFGLGLGVPYLAFLDGEQSLGLGFLATLRPLSPFCVGAQQGPLWAPGLYALVALAALGLRRLRRRSPRPA